MPSFQGVVGGIIFLIFVYLLFNSRETVGVMQGLAGSSSVTIKALQGRQ